MAAWPSNSSVYVSFAFVQYNQWVCLTTERRAQDLPVEGPIASAQSQIPQCLSSTGETSVCLSLCLFDVRGCVGGEGAIKAVGRYWTPDIKRLSYYGNGSLLDLACTALIVCVCVCVF